jgi:phospholipid transport system substrate-binding protein
MIFAPNAHSKGYIMIPALRTIQSFISILIIFFFSFTSTVFAKPQNAEISNFVTSLSNQVIDVLKKNVNSLAGRKAGFEEIFQKAGDVPKIAKFVAGPAWKSTPIETQQEYVEVYRQYMAYTYASRITAYNNQQVKIGRISNLGLNGFLVDTQLISPNTNNVMSVIWQLSYNNDILKVSDLRVENISMSLTQRAEFAAYLALNNNSLKSLTTLLQNRLGDLNAKKKI